MEAERLRNRNVLLTGGTGFVGHHLAERLLGSEISRLLVLCRRSGAIGFAHDARVRCVESSLEAVRPELWSEHGVERIDIVFHLGAFTPKNASEANDVGSVYQANLLGTRALLESLPNVPEQIVFASTLDVYKPASGVINEQSSLGPSGLYGASKIFCEKLVEAYGRSRDCGFSILRYGHIYGPGEEAYAKLIPQTIRTLLAGGSPIVQGDGNTLRDFLYVSDVVEATIRAALVDTKSQGPINVVAGRSYPIREIVELLHSIVGSASEIRYLRDRPNGHSFRFDNSKMLDAFGRWEFVPLETGLRREVQHFRSIA